MGWRLTLARAADGLRGDWLTRTLAVVGHAVLWGAGAALGHWLLHELGIGG